MDEVNAVSVFLAAVIVLGYGTSASFLQERFGNFQSLSPEVKKVVNVLLTVGIPYLVQFVSPYWRPSFGEPEAVLQELAVLLIPILIWAVSQVAHHFDPVRFEAGSLRKKAEGR